MYGNVQVCTGAYGGRKRMSDYMELQSQVAVSHMMSVLGTELRFSARPASVLHRRAFSVHLFYILKKKTFI